VNTAGAFTANANEDYKVSGITYDANGNIKTLQRKGYTDASGTNAMDNFSYNYGAGRFSNRLNYVKDTNDNIDQYRYDDLKDQENISVVGSNALPLPNYVYNDLGQLVINYQDKVIYGYNASGLVEKISTFDSQASGTYTTVDYQNYIDGITGKKDWISSGGGTGFNVFHYADNPECPALSSIYGNMLRLTGSGSRVKRVPTSPNTFYMFSMDVIMDRKLFDELVFPDDDLLNAWAVVTIKNAAGSVLATYSINNQAVEYCNRFYDQQVNASFTTGATDEYINIELTLYNNALPGAIGSQRAFIDNTLLKASISTKVAFKYNDRGQRIKKESFLFSQTDYTFYVRDAAGSIMAVYSQTIGEGKPLPPQVSEHSIYGSGRIGVFKRQNITAGGYALYELTDHLGNVRAVIMKSGTNALSLSAKTDYYPFGEPMPNKHTTDGNYRYAFQGQEKDGETGMEAFELRLWDGRIGRWLTVDPCHEFFSPYVGMGNNPISLIDPDGGSTTPTDFVNTKTGETVYINDGMDQVVFVNDKDWAFIQGMETARTWNKPDSERYFSIIFV
jgi:RHS repeat-associated protein